MKTYWIDPDTERMGKNGLVIEAVGHLDKHGVDDMPTRRVLQNYALIYLVEGEGTFTSASAGEQRVRPGDLLLVMPGEWHHYGPRNGGKWIEYFMIFDGFIPRTHQGNGVFDPMHPVIQTGQSPELHALFSDAYERVQQCGTGYTELVLADLFLIIAKGVVNPPSPRCAHDRLVESIKEAMAIRIRTAIDLREILGGTGYRYDYARRVFREQTGLSPGAYLTRLRMGKAKKLLVETHLTSAEIGYKVGFEDPAYFCRIFKKWVGLRPSTFRTEYRQWGRATPKA